MPCSRYIPALPVAVLLTLATSQTARAQQTLPVPRNHVEDRANVMDTASERRIDGYLTELEQKTGAQIIVLTIDTTGGEDIFGFAMRHAETWKLGQKGKDNGLLIAVAVKDRKYQILPGYGLEGVLPDAWLHLVREQAHGRGDPRHGFRTPALEAAEVLRELLPEGEDGGVDGEDVLEPPEPGRQ